MKELKVYMVIQNKDAEVSYGVDNWSSCAGIFLDRDDAIELIRKLTNEENVTIDKWGRACLANGIPWVGFVHNDGGDEEVRYRILELLCGEQTKNIKGKYPLLGGAMYYGQASAFKKRRVL